MNICYEPSDDRKVKSMHWTYEPADLIDELVHHFYEPSLIETTTMFLKTKNDLGHFNYERMS